MNKDRMITLSWLVTTLAVFLFYPILLIKMRPEPINWRDLFLVPTSLVYFCITHHCVYKKQGNRWLVYLLANSSLGILILPANLAVAEIGRPFLSIFLVVGMAWFVLSLLIFRINRKIRRQELQRCYLGWKSLTLASSLDELNQKFLEFESIAGESDDLKRVLRGVYYSRKTALEAAPVESNT